MTDKRVNSTNYLVRERLTFGYRDDAYKCTLAIQKIVVCLIIVANGVIIGRDVTSHMARPTHLVTCEMGSCRIRIQPSYCQYEKIDPLSSLLWTVFNYGIITLLNSVLFKLFRICTLKILLKNFK